MPKAASYSITTRWRYASRWARGQAEPPPDPDMSDAPPTQPPDADPADDQKPPPIPDPDPPLHPSPPQQVPDVWVPPE